VIVVLQSMASTSVVKKRSCVILLIAVILGVTWAITEWFALMEKAPRESDKNLVTFLESYSDVTDIAKLTIDGKPYIKVIRDVDSSILHLPSGPPVYIFDRSGVLVDWTLDLGDDPAFELRWGNTGSGVSIGSQQAKDLINIRDREPTTTGPTT